MRGKSKREVKQLTWRGWDDKDDKRGKSQTCLKKRGVVSEANRGGGWYVRMMIKGDEWIAITSLRSFKFQHSAYHSKAQFKIYQMMVRTFRAEVSKYVKNDFECKQVFSFKAAIKSLSSKCIFIYWWNWQQWFS